MDRYHQVHERDEASFDLSSTHRLPTVSAAEALEDLEDGTLRYVSTGLDSLDGSLAQPLLDEGRVSERKGGMPRGQITEVWGPPGSGKTALGIQLVAGALAAGRGAVWVDCAYTTCGRRMAAVARAARAGRDSPGASAEEAAFDERLAHFTCPSIPHLVALLCRPTASAVPSDTVIIVIDALSTLINTAFPKGTEVKQGPPIGKGSGTAAKRLQTLQYLIGALQKLAATRNCAIVVLSQCATKLQPDGGATLTPSLNANVWEQGVSTRIVLFRDWVWKDEDPSTVWFAGVQKLEGKTGPEAILSSAAFRIESAGLVEVQHDASQASIVVPAAARQKRKLGDTGLEIPDSDEDDEDYGWQVDDDAAAPVPPQTQGSEDLIVGVHRYEDDDDEDANDEVADGGDAEDGAGANGPDPGFPAACEMGGPP